MIIWVSVEAVLTPEWGGQCAELIVKAYPTEEAMRHFESYPSEMFWVDHVDALRMFPRLVPSYQRRLGPGAKEKNQEDKKFVEWLSGESRKVSEMERRTT